MKHERFYHLFTTGMAACDITDADYEIARETWLCLSCMTPHPSVGAIDVHLMNRRPVVAPITFVNGCGLGLAHKELLLSLGAENVERDLMLGRVFGPSGSEFADWATFRGRQSVIVRGTEHVTSGTCAKCGRTMYFSMGKKYLYPSPPTDAAILESHTWGLIIGEGLANQVDLEQLSKSWPKLGVMELRVPDAPPDGLGALPGTPVIRTDQCDVGDGHISLREYASKTKGSTPSDDSDRTTSVEGSQRTLVSP